jgi:3-methyl-2-oxobutanoate hydroxymethyltransferase
MSAGSAAQAPKRLTCPQLRAMKGATKIVAITAYDAVSGKLVDPIADLVLVGDSLGPNVLGYDSTIPVTLDEMIAAGRAVSRGSQRALLVGDLPFGTYQASPEDAVRSSARFIKEAGMQAVKLEGGAERANAIAAVVDAGIPVVAHIGLLPQSVHAMGGYRVQGKTEQGARDLLEDAKAVAAAGAFALVLEGIPDSVAAAITTAVDIPTIGIGAGASCDGQILVFTDVMGLNFGHLPKFVRPYANLREVAAEGLAKYRDEVRNGKFPSSAESYGG